jgi:hypothetical protein
MGTPVPCHHLEHGPWDPCRTATVTAQGKVRLYALDREDFLGAVTGNASSAALAEAVVSDRLREGGKAWRDGRAVVPEVNSRTSDQLATQSEP